MSKFVIVIPSGKEFEVGLADGINPWVLQATCRTASKANRICTLLAMHYKVPAHTLDQEELSPPHNGFVYVDPPNWAEV